ncbi:MAG: hypothetical protein Kow0010_04570 [Dehalococcoidia bacterium]
MTGPQRTIRRRLDEPDTGEPAGRGCLIAGGILGVIAGVVLGLLGLPPLLNALFSGDPVAFDETFDGDGRVISILSLEQGPDVLQGLPGGETAGVAIRLSVTARRTWEVEPRFFQLELTTGGRWIDAAPPVDTLPETSLHFPLGESRELLLQFPIPPGREGAPKYLHLSDPNIKFELSPP